MKQLLLRKSGPQPEIINTDCGKVYDTVSCWVINYQYMFLFNPLQPKKLQQKRKNDLGTEWLELPYIPLATILTLRLQSLVI